MNFSLTIKLMSFKKLKLHRKRKGRRGTTFLIPSIEVGGWVSGERGITDANVCLEVQSQGELDLAIRAKSDRPFNRLTKLPPGCTCKRLRERLAGLK